MQECVIQTLPYRKPYPSMNSDVLSMMGSLLNSQLSTSYILLSLLTLHAPGTSGCIHLEGDAGPREVLESSGSV